MANPGKGETFEFMSFAWDVDAAWRLAAGREPNGQVPLEPLFERMADVIRIDHQHALSDAVDPRLPVIVVPLPIGGHLVIDGWHRMAKALWAGATHHRAHILSAEEELAVRIHGEVAKPAA